MTGITILPNANDPNQEFVNNQIWLGNVNGNTGSTYTVALALASPQLWYPNNMICQTVGHNCRWACHSFQSGIACHYQSASRTTDRWDI